MIFMVCSPSGIDCIPPPVFVYINCTTKKGLYLSHQSTWHLLRLLPGCVRQQANYELYSVSCLIYYVQHYTPISFMHIMMIKAMGFILCLVMLAVKET